MFTKIHANGVASSDGFVVEITKVTELRYREGQRLITVPLELLMGECDFVVHMNHVKCWDAPFNNDAIEPERLNDIRERVEDGLQFLGIRVRFG